MTLGQLQRFFASCSAEIERVDLPALSSRIDRVAPFALAWKKKPPRGREPIEARFEKRVGLHAIRILVATVPLFPHLFHLCLVSRKRGPAGAVRN
jgi:hypothetical protein